MTTKYKFMKAVGVTMAGMMIMCNASSVQAKSVGSGNDLVMTLEQMSGVKYGESDSTDYSNSLKGTYEVSIEGKAWTSNDLHLTAYDLSSYTSAELEEVTGNELYFLKCTYDYILEFGCSYQGELFYTYTDNQVTAVEFDHYVYSLVQECVNRGTAKSSDYSKYYNELVGVRECIFNFSQVSKEFREEQENTINDIYWARDSKYTKFKQ